MMIQSGPVRLGRLYRFRRRLVPYHGGQTGRNHYKSMFRKIRLAAVQSVGKSLLAEGLGKRAATGISGAHKDDAAGGFVFDRRPTQNALVNNSPAFPLDFDPRRGLAIKAQPVVEDQRNLFADGFKYVFRGNYAANSKPVFTGKSNRPRRQTQDFPEGV